MGLNAATGTGNAGNVNTGNQIAAEQFGANSLNNAWQGGISNYLTHDYLNKNPPGTLYSGRGRTG